MPLFSIVVPVKDRPDELRRALGSVAQQTVCDFECIVVDDASSEALGPTVAKFDERFTCVRRDQNGGPTAARLTGFARAKGDFVLNLDSDNELFPWTLERARHYLREHPQVDCAAGLFVFPDGLHVRIGGGFKVIGREEFAAISSPRALGDYVGIVRHCVVDEWLKLRPDYFAVEVVFSLLLYQSHSAVFVDEPWGRYHVAAQHRMSVDGQTDDRGFEDIKRFVRDFRPLIGASPSFPVDFVLTNMWVALIRARRYGDAATVADWMRQRGLSLTTTVARKIAFALQNRITARCRPRIDVL